MKKQLLISSTFLMLGFFVSGQDVHFSNPDQQPLMMNPALAGVEGTLQANLSYRTQWSSVPVPFTTTAASVQGRYEGKGKGGFVAGGLQFVNDRAGELRVVTNQVNMNLSYHLMLNRSSTISIGMYGGFGQRSIDPDGGRWGSQYDGTAYNASLPGGNALSNPSFAHFDAGSGFMYIFHQRNGAAPLNVHVGYAAFHVNRPSYSFVNDGSDPLSIRHSIFADAEIGISGTRGAIHPLLSVQLQNKASEVLVGLDYQYILTKGSRSTGRKRPASFSIGLFNRVKDAMIVRTQFEKDMYALGFSYDLNISEFISSTRGRGGFELYFRFLYDSGRIKRR
jgi:type IX secretion system PorP/SprF family membrane protein